MESHRRFAEKFDLTVPLLADTDGAVCKLLGVPVGPSGSAARMTFIIGGDGIVLIIYDKVTVAGHAEQVLAAIQALVAGEHPAGE